MQLLEEAHMRWLLGSRCLCRSPLREKWEHGCPAPAHPPGQVSSSRGPGAGRGISSPEQRCVLDF